MMKLFNHFKRALSLLRQISFISYTTEMLLAVLLSICLLLGGCNVDPSTVSVATKSDSALHDIAPLSSSAQCQDFMQYAQQNKADRYLCRAGYVVNYNDQTKQPNWVAYRLTGKSVAQKLPRKDHFIVDTSIPKGYRAELSDYKGSGYDRGHLAPYAAMDFSHYSAGQSFLLSNMSPQVAGLNRHGWAQLEKYERFWARAKGELYVYTGVIYKHKTPRTFIGKNKVAVPDYFYKIIYAPKSKEVIAFAMPNSKVDKSEVAHYRTSVADIEQRTGFTFFNHLAAGEREALIYQRSKMWRTDYKHK